MEINYECTYTLHVHVSTIYLKNRRITLKNVFEILSDKDIALCHFSSKFFAKTK
jgi:hypothetical protein